MGSLCTCAKAQKMLVHGTRLGKVVVHDARQTPMHDARK